MKAAFPNVKIIGGVVEEVPSATMLVANKDTINFPKTDVSVRVVGVPCHTRGSLCFVLRNSGTTFLFTGDALFCGGCGAPFEASATRRKCASALSLSQTVAEILLAATESCDPFSAVTSGCLVYPGHDYARPLLAQQLSSIGKEEEEGAASFLQNFAILETFFAASLVSQGKERSASSPYVPLELRKELDINGEYRKLVSCGLDVVAALEAWGASESGVTEGSLTVPLDTSLVLPPVPNKSSNPDQFSPPPPYRQGRFEAFVSADIDSVLKLLDGPDANCSMASSYLQSLRKGVPGRSDDKPRRIPTHRELEDSLLKIGQAPRALRSGDDTAMNITPLRSKTVEANRMRALLSRLELRFPQELLAKAFNGSDAQDVRVLVELLLGPKENSFWFHNSALCIPCPTRDWGNAQKTKPVSLPVPASADIDI